MKLAIVLGAAAVALSAPAYAQVVEERTTVVRDRSGESTAAGALTGAAAGAAIGGPVGAAVGAVTGAAVGAIAAPPKEVRTYVTTQRVAPVAYNHEIIVGRPLPGEVTLLEVPSYPKYRWAYINGQRVVIDADTRTVVAIY
ncbi:MAG TPA: DUF1236 domain-containing protein [Caulobacteraceae bacterium]|nr:DUF1236 domain-containing protein [Caulobacteraceae bacterium]